MIASFNRRQTLLAAGHFLLSLLAVVVTYRFFLYAADEVLELLKVLPFYFAPSASLPHWIAIGCTSIVIVYGIWYGVRGGGHFDFHQSDLYLAPDYSNIGYTDFRSIGTLAHLLSQIFLAAPLQTLTGIACLKSRLPEDPELEHLLSTLLSRVEGTRKWHPTTVYTGHTTELGYLVRMGKVLFSPSKGLVSPL